ncbi:NAD(P)-binding protein [Pseudochryseolinea flava]|nr:NAD(P)/FAD-dependent oxidoreductase [Pseudochryseolinea flava]
MRQSLQAAVGTTLLTPAFNACTSEHIITGKVIGPNAALGHRLRDMKFESPTQSKSTDVLIVGGGVAALSAARVLKQNNVSFHLLELGTEAGGNSVAGKNHVTAYPWGAHYLPLPNHNDPELIAFLKEAGVIIGEANGLPVFQDYYLCFDPKERLYINNFWQDSLLPHEGISLAEREEIDRFTTLMHEYKIMKGRDGKDAFTIPIAMSSQDDVFLALDKISMHTFLIQHDFHSEALHWYVDYCCADDFGATSRDVSAWAGIHYFASRKGRAANASDDTLLTWPEGNNFLVKKLQAYCQDEIETNALVYGITIKDDGVEVLFFDAKENRTVSYHARQVILATPQYINNRIFPQGKTVSQSFQYAPWMIANITIGSSLSERKGEQIAWDNVIFGSQSLGYVNASHQYVGIATAEKVLTYYYPLTGSDTTSERRRAYERGYDDWKEIILKDLSKAHPNIAKEITNIDIWIWGHGMIRPAPGLIWGQEIREVAASVDQKIFKAHSDLSGISIFEEAFYQGHQAAKLCLKHRP